MTGQAIKTGSVSKHGSLRLWVKVKCQQCTFPSLIPIPMSKHNITTRFSSSKAGVHYSFLWKQKRHLNWILWSERGERTALPQILFKAKILVQRFHYQPLTLQCICSARSATAEVYTSPPAIVDPVLLGIFKSGNRCIRTGKAAFHCRLLIFSFNPVTSGRLMYKNIRHQYGSH